MKTLVVYYSYSGNTKYIVEQIAQCLNADIISLEPVIPYSSDYDTVVAQGQEEVGRNYMPELKPISLDIANYDRIIIGTPTWWYKMASPVLTFLSQNDFSNKNIALFMTNAGWPGTVIKDMKELCNNANIIGTKEFEVSSDISKITKDEIRAWTDSLKQ